MNMNKEDLVCYVRPPVQTDKDAWCRLWQGYCDFYGIVLRPGVADTLWDRIMTADGPVRALVATKSQETPNVEVVGFANYVLHPYTWGTELICYLEDLFVAEHARCNGVGSALIAELELLCQKNDWPRLYWHTHEANEIARSLYERFTPVDPFVRYLIKIR